MNIMIIPRRDGLHALCIFDKEDANEGAAREIGMAFTFQELVDLQEYLAQYTSGSMQRMARIFMEMEHE